MERVSRIYVFEVSTSSSIHHQGSRSPQTDDPCRLERPRSVTGFDTSKDILLSQRIITQESEYQVVYSNNESTPVLQCASQIDSADATIINIIIFSFISKTNYDAVLPRLLLPNVRIPTQEHQQPPSLSHEVTSSPLADSSQPPRSLTARRTWRKHPIPPKTTLAHDTRSLRRLRRLRLLQTQLDLDTLNPLMLQ